MDHATERDQVQREAKTWLRTPYHPRQQVKGAGVDCAMLPAAVYHSAGLIPKIAVEYYPQDWHLHQDEERYLKIVETFATRMEGPPNPGDFAIWKVGRCWAHGAIVMGWPRIIHAVMGQGVVWGDAQVDCLGKDHRLADLPLRFYTLWGEG
ncbi:hydrolase [Paramagnetospirillum magneticum]|uniref:Cell wall-associated hydrolase n=1 Tax=Paramagnetospirillum magneticum (strain ATCC 700264 / AMB-1) TaxID=342108 RepID=Q2WA45_PARM1|nr:hydrolase [Paramagnetospirillum magneticum]BAE49280.1 Cell wall-associated hydrolase [Paramagnetospirillum magneticum AMB-1]